MKSLFPIATLIALGTVTGATSGCGNGWTSSKEREKSPSALMLKAQLLYDKGNFVEAAAAYQAILDVSPQNERARLRLSYALNGEAGLGPLDLLTKLSKAQATPAPAAKSGAAPSASTTSKNSLTQLTGAAGLSSAEVAAVIKANPKTFQDLLTAETKYASMATSDATSYANLVTASRRFQKLQASWRTVCQLIPKRILDAVVNVSEVRKKAFEIEKCLGGFDSEYQKPAILFAAAIGTLAQGAALYQIKLDTDNDGTVDAIKTAETLAKDLSGLGAASTTVTDPAEIKKNIDTLNTKVTALNAIGETLKHELVDVALAQFEIMSLLLTAIEDVIPENVGKTLLAGIKKFEESKGKITGYVNTKSTSSSGKTSAAKQDKIAASAASASKAADAYYDKYKTQIATDPQAADKQVEFDASFAKTCDQFDALKATYGATTAQKPANCAQFSLALGRGFGLSAAIDHGDAPGAAFVESDISGEGMVSPIEAPLEGDARKEFLDFIRLGDRILRAN